MGLSRISAAACVLLLCACEIEPRLQEPRDRPAPFHPAVEMLERYDADHDGTLTRTEMETGLKADFAAADTDHDGRLNEEETRAVNYQRWADNASTASTLVDWNQDGFVAFSEFAGTARSLFAELDRDGDGVLSPREWHPPKAKPDRPVSSPEAPLGHP